MIPISKNIALLAFLYFIQGLPYGLQARFLPIYLRTRGMSLTNVGLFKLLLLPWMCKALWAPFVDKFGTKKSWLIWSLFGLIVTSAIGSMLEPSELLKLGILMLVLNIATSTQDIAVDGLAIGILASTELAQGNIAQVVGYKFGAIVGGGVFLWLSNYITWSLLFWILTGTYSLAVFIVIYQVKKESQEKPSSHHENLHLNNKTEIPMESSFRGQMLKHIADIFNTEGTVWICVYVLIYKLGEVSALNMLPLFMVDQNVSSSKVGFWTGVAGQGFSIAGSVVGGWLISYYSFTTVQVTRFVCSVRVLLLLIQLIIVSVWPLLPELAAVMFALATSSMCGLLVLSGMVTTATFTMMMECSQRAHVTVQASHYTTLATLEVMGKLLFSVITGTITDLLGYQFIFLLFTVLALLVLPVFKFCPSIIKQSTMNKNH